MRGPPLPNRPAWKLLEKHYQKSKSVHLRDLFSDDRGRGEKMAIEAAGLYLDYSKNRITDETLRLLLQLARESALRPPRGASIMHDGRNVVPDVHAVLDRMTEFADRLRSGAWKGHTGKRIRNVINIGIGGGGGGPGWGRGGR